MWRWHLETLRKGIALIKKIKVSKEEKKVATVDYDKVMEKLVEDFEKKFPGLLQELYDAERK